MTRLVYHGSNEPGIESIAGSRPSYDGSIGAGVYVTFDPHVARFYGENVYSFELLIDDAEILWLTPETMRAVPYFEGHSVLQGESVPPFTFDLKDQRFTVGWDEMLDDILGMRVRQAAEGLIGQHEAARLTEAGGRIPDEDDIVEWVNGLDEDDVEKKLQGAGIDISGLGSQARHEMLIELVVDPILEAVDSERERAKKEFGLFIDLDDIGNEAEHVGYKAVSLEGARGRFPDEELLVFDEVDLQPAGTAEVDGLKWNPKIVGGVHTYAAAGVTPNGDVVSMPDPPPRVTIGSRSYSLSDIMSFSLAYGPEFEEGGARVMSGKGSPWRYVWVHEPESGQLDMYRYSDGEWKVLGSDTDDPETFNRLRRARQLNTVTPAELDEFESHMREKNKETIESLQKLWDGLKTPEQKRVEQLVRRYWDEKTQPIVDNLWASIDLGAEPIGFEYDEEFAERTGNRRPDQAKAYAMAWAIRRSGFEPYNSPLEDYVVQGLGMSTADEMSDIQAVHWAHGDVLDAIYRSL